MPSVSSHGHAPASPKTIDVRANLLEEWIARRDKTKDRFKRYLFIAGVLLVSSAVIVPSLVGFGRRELARQMREEEFARSLAAQVRAVQDEAQAKDPAASRQKMLLKSSLKARAFCAAFANALNAPGDGVVLSRLRGEMLGGELDITGQADAINDASARGTVKRLGAVSDVNAALLTASRPNPAIGKTGVEFEFLTRRQLSP
jgi:hypothetical protein